MPNEAAPTTETDDWAAAIAEQEAADQGLSQSAQAQQPPPAKAPLFETLASTKSGTHANSDIDLIMDIPVQLTVELGRTKVPIKDILQMAQGSVVELDALAGEPLDVFVNGCLVAQGEVVVVNDKFGIRLTDIFTPSERIRKLNR